MKWYVTLYAILIGMLYGVIATAQVLGILGIYHPWLAVPLSLVAAGLVTWGYLRAGSQVFYTQIFNGSPEDHSPVSWLEMGFSICGGLVILALVVLPVAGWPYTPISETLQWDAGVYHFPKALELLKTGSAWDFTISYGEYPFGYEALFSFAAALTRNGHLFGAAHLLSSLLFLGSLWFLLRRATGLPAGVTLWISTFLLMSGLLSEFDSNLWWVYKHLVYTIGKNDLFLGAALLAVILHAPVGPASNERAWHPFGLAVTSMLAAAIKPNALPLIAFIWAWTGWRTWRAGQRVSWKQMLVWLLLVLPGLLWIGRNLVAQGRLFSEGAMELQSWSIAANLFQPGFYQNIPQDLIRVILIFAVSIPLAFFLRHLGGSMVAVFGVLLVVFAVTPASGYFGRIGERPEIAWRFATAALAFAFLLPMAWFGPWLRRLYRWASAHRVVQMIALVVIVVCSGWFFWIGRTVISFRPRNVVVLEDQFRDPVGVNGYHSAYDYVRQNVRDAVVWVENGMPFYAYGPGFTNSTTRTQKSDYLVIFQTAWGGGEAAYPDYLNDSTWQADWTLRYEDSQGRVYQRIK